VTTVDRAHLARLMASETAEFVAKNPRSRELHERAAAGAASKNKRASAAKKESKRTAAKIEKAEAVDALEGATGCGRWRLVACPADGQRDRAKGVAAARRFRPLVTEPARLRRRDPERVTADLADKARFAWDGLGIHSLGRPF